MEKSRIEELIAKYNEGLADPLEIKVLEELIERGEIQLTRLRELDSLDELLMKSESPAPSMELDDRFQAMVSEEKRKLKSSFSFRLADPGIWIPRLAWATALIIIGFSTGFWLRPESSNPDVTSEVRELKEMVMLSLLEKESATDRLRAVNLTTGMEQVSDKITGALFQTLNNDPNENVRLAALEALTPYTNRSDVREHLIHSIANQESPLVQVTLAELMVALQEKKSVSELQKILNRDQTPADVKNKLRKSIEVLI